MVASRLECEEIDGVKYWSAAAGAARSQPETASFKLLVFLDGRVAGHWKRSIKKSSVEIETAFYRPFGIVQKKALRAAADVYGKFLGIPAVLV